MFQSLQGRYTEHIMKQNLPQALLMKPVQPKNLEHSQETWIKKNKERISATRSKYFSVPSNIPGPQKKQTMIPNYVTDRKKSPISMSQCESDGEVLEPMDLCTKEVSVDQEVMWS